MRFLIAVALIFLSALSLSGSENPEYRIVFSENKQEISLAELAESLTHYQVIFFGEYHENSILHKLEIDLLKKMYENSKDLVVSMEMFERDTQPYIDDYLSGEISETAFLQNSRPWSNYQQDYRPLIEFAREQDLDVIAANVPRRYAAEINKAGLNALDSLEVHEKKLIASKHVILDDEYKERFIATLKKNLAHSTAMSAGKEMDFELLYAAQCLKDDTMAESILEQFSKDSGKIIIHYNGDFHSRKHLGTAQKLKLLDPQLKIAVISPVYVDRDYQFTEDDLLEGDFLILLREPEKE